VVVVVAGRVVVVVVVKSIASILTGCTDIVFVELSEPLIAP